MGLWIFYVLNFNGSFLADIFSQSAYLRGYFGSIGCAGLEEKSSVCKYLPVSEVEKLAAP